MATALPVRSVVGTGFSGELKAYVIHTQIMQI